VGSSAAELTKQYGRELTEMEYQLRNWYYFVWLCGDHICEQHIHNLDMVNWLKAGHPTKARGNGGCETRKGPDYGEIFDHHVVEFTYPDDRFVSVVPTFNWVAGMKWPTRHRLQRQERLRAQRYQRPEFVAPSRRAERSVSAGAR